ncbi:hypothetical protein PGT21_008865 [Puccinia graminis f. sp. tritici]|uniref:Uncharacterized protein n=1 Tax=Puccinia graminis f. sp. tritici TaxID=56615 RepID=A0A5B0LS82_PUCGR|nr:hypothetical protein PGTUg99_031840 [Puccinia graminis f. sp. tritici]KAA1071468.1 hypothetical protein PGT21_008865 [Puccinia graminis f. sp. tritici]
MTVQQLSNRDHSWLGIMCTLTFFSHLVIAQVNTAKKCGRCLWLAQEGLGLPVGRNQRTLKQEQTWGALPCTIMRQQNPNGCLCPIGVQLHCCPLCGIYAWVPYQDCPRENHY